MGRLEVSQSPSNIRRFIQGGHNQSNPCGEYGRGQGSLSSSCPPIPGVPCKLCLVLNPSLANSHNIGNCFSLSSAERTAVIRSAVLSLASQDDTNNLEDDSLHN